MHSIYVLLYFIAFAVIAGGAFALMWQNLRTLEWDKMPKKHPEAPEPGEEVMYVDLEKEKLEDLFNK